MLSEEFPSFIKAPILLYSLYDFLKIFQKGHNSEQCIDITNSLMGYQKWNKIKIESLPQRRKAPNIWIFSQI